MRATSACRAKQAKICRSFRSKMLFVVFKPLIVTLRAYLELFEAEGIEWPMSAANRRKKNVCAATEMIRSSKQAASKRLFMSRRMNWLERGKWLERRRKKNGEEKISFKICLHK